MCYYYFVCLFVCLFHEHSYPCEASSAKFSLFVTVLLTCRTLPLSVYIGVAIVTVSYLVVNVSFFAVLSYDQIESAIAVALVSHCIMSYICTRRMLSRKPVDFYKESCV